MLAFSRYYKNSNDLCQNHEEHNTKLCGALSILNRFDTENTEQDIQQLLMSSTNRAKNDEYKILFVNNCLPSLINTNFAPDSMTYRQSIILCRNLMNRSTSSLMSMIPGFFEFIERAINNHHPSISQPACDIMVKLIAYNPNFKELIYNNVIIPTMIMNASNINLTSGDSFMCLDALHVIRLLNDESILSPDHYLCENIANVFCNSQTPFVSKKSAELILDITRNDEPARDVICRIVRQQTNDSKPMKASRSWQEVNDVIAMALSLTD